MLPGEEETITLRAVDSSEVESVEISEGAELFTTYEIAENQDVTLLFTNKTEAGEYQLNFKLRNECSKTDYQMKVIILQEESTLAETEEEPAFNSSLFLTEENYKDMRFENFAEIKSVDVTGMIEVTFS